jgi:hypothetical protein
MRWHECARQPFSLNRLSGKMRYFLVCSDLHTGTDPLSRHSWQSITEPPGARPITDPNQLDSMGSGTRG